MTPRPFYELTGRLATFNALQSTLAQAPRLLVIAAEPRSGTSRLLAQFDEAAATRLVLVDARPCLDGLDLATQIADAAVEQLAPAAANWWQSTGMPSDTNSLRLSRALSEDGIDLDSLRFSSGPDAERLDEAMRLATHLLRPTRGAVVIDHFGELLAGLTAHESRKLLGDLRVLAQRKDFASLVLVDAVGGPTPSAVEDPGHPLFHAGQTFEIRRAQPSQFINDLAVTKPSLPAGTTAALIVAAAEIADGVPDLVWQIIALAPEGLGTAAAAATGWQRLRDAADAQLAAEWTLLRRVHPHAQTVCAALACGLAPTAAVPNPRSASDALTRLHAMNFAWQPRTRKWALSDPLLASWVADNAPPWARRQQSTQRAAEARDRANRNTHEGTV